MNRRQIVAVLLTLCLAAFALCVGAIVVLQAWEHPNAFEHSGIADSLLKGHGFSRGEWGYYGPSSNQAPTYPLLLASLFGIFGVASSAAYAAAMIINAMVGAGTVWLTYLLARTFGARRSVAVTAAFLCAVWPTQIYAVTNVQAITFISAAIPALIVLFYRSIRTGRLGACIGFSVLAGFSALTEPVLLPAMALSGLLFLIWRSELPWNLRVRNAVILLLVAVTIVGPWTIRNRIVHKAWMPVKSTFWVNVWKGNNENATGTDRLALTEQQLTRLKDLPLWEADALVRGSEFDARRQYDMLTEAQVALLEGKPEVEREQIFRGFALDWIRANRSRYVELCLLRLAKSLWIDWDNPKARNEIYVSFRAFLLLFGSIGLFLALQRRWSLLYPLIIFGSCLLVYTLTITAARFSIPFEPLAFCLAALTLVSLWEWHRTRGGSSEQPLAA